MPFDETGNFRRQARHLWQDNTPIVTDDVNEFNDDIGTSLSNCILKNGRSRPTADIPFNGKKITQLADGTEDYDAVNLKQVEEGYYSKSEIDNSFDNVYTKSEIDNIVSNAMPAASIIARATASIPSGWLECNGSAISRTTYASLFSAIGTHYGSGNGSSTFNIPDLRGEFIRGFDNNRGVDSGRSLGSYQAGSLQSHNHSITLSMRTGGIHGGYRGPYWSSEHIHHGNGTATTTSSGGSETRPRNIALKYIIKY